MIDGAPGKAVPVAAQRGFAKGAPYSSDHGSAVASLLAGAGVRRVLAADVYGTDPAGGNALAIARALDWLAGKRRQSGDDQSRRPTERGAGQGDRRGGPLRAWWWLRP